MADNEKHQSPDESSKSSSLASGGAEERAANKERRETILTCATVVNLLLTVITGIVLVIYFNFRNEKFQIELISLQSDVDRQAKMASVYIVQDFSKITVKNNGPSSAEEVAINVRLVENFPELKNEINSTGMFKIGFTPSLSDYKVNYSNGFCSSCPSGLEKNMIEIFIPYIPANSSVAIYFYLDPNQYDFAERKIPVSYNFSYSEIAGIHEDEIDELRGNLLECFQEKSDKGEDAAICWDIWARETGAAAIQSNTYFYNYIINPVAALIQERSSIVKFDISLGCANCSYLQESNIYISSLAQSVLPDSNLPDIDFPWPDNFSGEYIFATNREEAVNIDGEITIKSYAKINSGITNDKSGLDVSFEVENKGDSVWIWVQDDSCEIINYLDKCRTLYTFDLDNK